MPQPRLIAAIASPEELLTISLPPSWALKPVGAAYSEGLVLVRDGIDLLSRRPISLRHTVQYLQQLRSRRGEVASDWASGLKLRCEHATLMGALVTRTACVTTFTHSGL